jgi:hypothetical protein
VTTVLLTAVLAQAVWCSTEPAAANITLGKRWSIRGSNHRGEDRRRREVDVKDATPHPRVRLVGRGPVEKSSNPNHCGEISGGGDDVQTGSECGVVTDIDSGGPHLSPCAAQVSGVRQGDRVAPPQVHTVVPMTQSLGDGGPDGAGGADYQGQGGDHGPEHVTRRRTVETVRPSPDST